MKEQQKDQVNVRVSRASWRKLKVMAAREGKTCTQKFDEITKEKNN